MFSPNGELAVFHLSRCAALRRDDVDGLGGRRGLAAADFGSPGGHLVFLDDLGGGEEDPTVGVFEHGEAPKGEPPAQGDAALGVDVLEGPKQVFGRDDALLFHVFTLSVQSLFGEWGNGSGRSGRFWGDLLLVSRWESETSTWTFEFIRPQGVGLGD